MILEVGNFVKDIGSVDSLLSLQSVRVKYLGKAGSITLLSKEFKKITSR